MTIEFRVTFEELTKEDPELHVSLEKMLLVIASYLYKCGIKSRVSLEAKDESVTNSLDLPSMQR